MDAFWGEEEQHLLSRLGTLLELIPIPLDLLGLILSITAGYLVATEVVKRAFWARQRNALTLRTKDPAAS